MDKHLKLAVFDFDSTLMDGETIDFLAKDYGVEEEVKKITEKAMAGELDFFESLTYRIGLLKGMEVKRVNEICQNLPFVLGAKETITELKKRGLIPLIKRCGTPFMELIRKNLCGNHPCLQLFNLYKLLYYLNLNHE